MANHIKIIAGTSHPSLATEISQHLDVPLTASKIIRFGNENILFQCEENVRESDVFVIQTSAPPVSDGIMELLIIIDALKHASAKRITAVLPYFPYARSDKKDRPRISITARLMADLLQTAGADRVLTMNLHSPQVAGCFRIPVDHLNATPVVCDHLRNTTSLENTVLVASDLSEAKDLGDYANRLNKKGLHGGLKYHLGQIYCLQTSRIFPYLFSSPDLRTRLTCPASGAASTDYHQKHQQDC